MRVMNHACAPMACGGQSDAQVLESSALPSLQLNDASKSAVFHKAADAFRNDDRLRCGDLAQAGQV